MARVYYKRKKLLGAPKQKFEAMDLKIFEDIFSKGETLFEGVHPTNQSIQLELNSGDEPFFNYITIWRGDFEWKGIFLPDAIILSDKQNPAFSDEYYYVARIDQELDFRKVNRNSASSWEDSINKSVSVGSKTDEPQDLLDKLNYSFFRIYEKIEDAVVEKKERLKKVRQKLQSIPQNILVSFSRLSELCGWTQAETNKFTHYLSNKKWNGEDPYELLGFCEDYCYEVEKDHKPLFLYFDWKDNIEEFLWKFEKVVSNNFGITEPIPLGDYTKENQILEDGVMEHFDNFLRRQQLQLTQIETEGDDYLFVVHKIKDFKEVKSVIATIGWDISEV